MKQYSIGEVSDRVGQEPHVLRYWEQEFDILSPEKNGAGRRIYTESDIATVERIQYLLKDEMYTIAGARRALQRKDAADKREAHLREELKSMRTFLVQLRDKL